MHYLFQVHPKAQANHCRLQHELRKVSALPVKGMLRTQPEGQPCRQGQRRSNQPACGNDYSDIENILLPHSLENGRARPSQSRSSFELPITFTYGCPNQPTATELAAKR